MKLYVGNLPYGTTEGDLHDTFSAYGPIVSVNLITARHSGESKGFGFIEMEDNSAGDAAIKALNGTNFRGRSIKVNQASAKAKRPSRPRRR